MIDGKLNHAYAKFNKIITLNKVKSKLNFLLAPFLIKVLL